MNKKELEDKLQEYNLNISKLVRERTKFLDENMHVYAEFQIGDIVKNLSTHKKGVCVAHYRYHPGKSDYDTSFSCYCNIRILEYGEETKDWQSLQGGCIDNTSHYSGENPWYKPGDSVALKNKQEAAIRQAKW